MATNESRTRHLKGVAGSLNHILLHSSFALLRLRLLGGSGPLFYLLLLSTASTVVLRVSVRLDAGTSFANCLW